MHWAAESRWECDEVVVGDGSPVRAAESNSSSSGSKR